MNPGDAVVGGLLVAFGTVSLLRGWLRARRTLAAAAALVDDTGSRSRHPSARPLP